jgi:AraC-like DNA-binding protein
MKDIIRMLKYSDKSIKEIALELDFPNISFFGKYVKAHLGVSPKAYRRQ